MKRKIVLPLLIFAATLLSSCRSHAPTLTDVRSLRNPKPDWVENGVSNVEYPSDKYLIGVGVGDDRPTAEDRARGEIAKIFSTQVTVGTALSATESQVNGSDKFSQSVSQNVKTASDKILEGVEIADHWQDDRIVQYYALAILDRQKADQSIQDKIGEIDKEAKEEQTAIGNAADKFAKAEAAIRLLTILDARTKLNDELRIVSQTGGTVDSPIDQAQAKQNARQILAALNVSVNISGDGADLIRTGVVSGLSGLGLQVLDNSSQASADILVKAAITTTALEPSSSDVSWHPEWSRTSAVVSLTDGASSKEFQSFEASDREAAADQATSFYRSQKALSDKLAAQIQKAISSYFQNR